MERLVRAYDVLDAGDGLAEEGPAAGGDQDLVGRDRVGLGAEPDRMRIGEHGAGRKDGDPEAASSVL